ncbi:hypothetical protein ACQ33O_02230 [Ferruginibacter sp. SUN002]|uniref:hypothetical protein n=1 Tax=Ferruginibacter sp. SUN002 TaxID=2937789 RepID=UPI003D36031A
MTSITSDYLINIIDRCISTTISQRRTNLNKYEMPEATVATDEEILDFIISIPYFDTKLKDFIIGNLPMQAVIISQTWENEFIKKCMEWRGSKEWMHTDVSSFNSDKEQHKSFLMLPY